MFAYVFPMSICVYSMIIPLTTFVQLRDNFMEIQKKLKADMEAQVQQLQQDAAAKKKKDTFRLIKQEIAKVDNMIVSTKGMAEDVLTGMIEKKTELQMKLWMLEEDADCEGMTLEQLNQEFQKKSEQQPSKNQQSSDISTSATSSNSNTPQKASNSTIATST